MIFLRWPSLRSFLIPLLVIAFFTSSEPSNASQLTLTWTDNSDNEDGFKIERKQGQTGTFAQITTVGAGTSSYTDSNLATETTYCYQVRAFNGAGDSAYSNEDCSTTPAIVDPSIPITEEWGNTLTSNNPNTVEDTYINLNTQNYSQTAQLNSYTWPTNQIANAILMKWDLSAIPAGSTIQSATLYLYLQDFSGTGGDGVYDVSVNKVINKNPTISLATGITYDGSNPWTANSCCSNGTPLAQGDIAIAEDVQELDKTIGYKSWTITQMVQDWVNDGATNFGLLVNSDPMAAADSNRIFSSSEHGQAGQRPKLVITYASTQNTATLTVARVETLTNAGTWSGTVITNPAGIDCGADCSETYPSGTFVTLTAIPNTGSTFAGWGGGGCSGTGTCTVTMTADKTVSATFARANNTPVANAGPDKIINEGTLVQLVGTSSNDPDGDILTFFWIQTAGPGVTLSGANTVTPTFFTPFVGVTGALLTFQLTATDSGGLFSIDTVNIEVDSTLASTLVNLSTRSTIGTADNLLIGGFIIGGDTPATILVRARGPSLVDFAVPGALADPVLNLFSGQDLIASNDNWQDTQEGEIIATGSSPCEPWEPNGSAPTDCTLESAVLITLDPGPYTVHVSGLDGGTGVGLVEIFDLSNESALVNLSTRSVAGIGDNVIIAGFIIDSPTPATVILRATGPSLADLGVQGALANPVLNLFSGPDLIASNDDWQFTDPLCNPPALACDGETGIIATGLAPADPVESTILITLDPGIYTAHVSGFNGDTGVGLVEVFKLTE